MRPLRLGLAQINPAVGDLAGNTRKIIEVIDSARGNQVDLLAFPELAITGYPPEDLLLKHRFIKDNIECLHKIVESSRSMGVIVGFVDAGSDLYNSAGVIWDGKLTGVYHKTFLPNYGVFDENRYFVEGDEWPVYVICGAKIGVNICEDIWYPAGPISAQVNAGAELIVNINASPFHAGKCDSRHKMVSTRASDHTAIVAYVNLVGGQDELVFDGGSMVYDEQGKLLAEGKNFEEDLVIVDLNLDNVFRSRLHAPRLRKERFFHQNDSIKSPEIEVSRASLFPSKQPVTPQPAQKHDMTGEVYSALVMGTRDYVRKNGFDRVVIGLSGGIDSSLVAVIAVDALGRDKVTGVAMPSPFTSDASNIDAARLAENLGISLHIVPIDNIYKSYLGALQGVFEKRAPDVTEENIQARIRGNLLMALSNKFGWLVLTTGNKSEIATGYCTLYGDMAGGFAVIKDVPKTLVYKLSAYRNSRDGKELIPVSILTRAPSAELRPDQKDTDSLPPYDILDPLLESYVEDDHDLAHILGLGASREIVEKVIKMVDSNEYKRRQSAPGIKITPRAFGKDRRLPITNRYPGI